MQEKPRALEIAAHTGLRMGDDARVHGETTILREVRLEIAGGLTFGTADLVMVSAKGTAAELMDFKFGRNPVADAEENVQMQRYALGLTSQTTRKPRFPRCQPARSKGSSCRRILSCRASTSSSRSARCRRRSSPEPSSITRR